MYECLVDGCERSFETRNGRNSHHGQQHRNEEYRNGVECDNCGSVYYTAPSKEKRGEHNFCDRECFKSFYSGQNSPRWNSIEVECSQCGDIKFEEANRVERNEKFFCDSECYSQYKKENWNGEFHPSWTGNDHARCCPACGAIVRRPPSQYYGEKTFCDSECYSEYQREDDSRSMGPDFYQNRKDALERDEYECQVCWKSNSKQIDNIGIGLTVHHIIPRRTFDCDDPEQNEMWNLLTVCKSCHNKIEGQTSAIVHPSAEETSPTMSKSPI